MLGHSIHLYCISKQRSQLMGIAIVLVMLFHGFLPRESVFYGLKRMGNIGVDVFLLLSGIGLVFSYTKNASLKQFFFKRYKRIYITWLLLGGSFFVYQSWGNSFTIKDYITLAENVFFHLNFWKHANLTFWYVPAVMVLYAFAPFYMSLLMRSKFHRMWVIVPILWSIGVAFIPFLKAQWGYLEIFWSRIPIFMIGLCLGFEVKENKVLPANRFVLMILVASLSFIGAWWLEQQKHGLYPLFINRMLYIPTVVAGIPLVAMGLEHTPKWLNNTFKWLGTISLEVYLVHLHWVLVPLQKHHWSFFSTFMLCFCISIPMAWVAQRCISALQTVLYKSNSVTKKKNENVEINEKTMNNKREKWVLSDFDGTLTTHDSLLFFTQFVKGKWAMWASLFLFSPLLVLMKLKLYNNKRMKEHFLSFHFKGMSLSFFEGKCRLFAQKYSSIMRPKALEMLQECSDNGTKVIVVSASIEQWVQPFFAFMPQVQVIGTQLEVNNGIITGKIKGKNCYGSEKVERVKPLIANRKNLYIIAYGDSKGDYELLEYADEKHYKPFRA